MNSINDFHRLKPLSSSPVWHSSDISPLVFSCARLGVVPEELLSAAHSPSQCHVMQCRQLSGCFAGDKSS